MKITAQEVLLTPGHKKTASHDNLMKLTASFKKSASNLVAHAERELDLAGVGDEAADYDGMLKGAVIELVKVFASQGHSGFSASMVLSLFAKVANFEPLVPLTGEDSEWNDVSEMSSSGMLQNNRHSSVFRDVDTGRTYDIDGKVFRDPDGACYTNGDSHVDVTFPYTPTTEYVDVPFGR